MMLRARGGVSPEEVPEQIDAVEPRPSSRQNPLNTDESQTAHSENDKRVWGVTNLIYPVLLMGLFVYEVTITLRGNMAERDNHIDDPLSFLSTGGSCTQISALM